MRLRFFHAIVTIVMVAAPLRGEQKSVAERRASVAVICHRGASEFAHENTLDAYRATFELGGDGNEIDIRQTKDGVLVCFHDDMLDLLLENACGDVADFNWPELQKFLFRDPGPMAATARIPTLDEVLEFHKAHGGLLVLDVKRTGLDDAIAKKIEQHGVWDNVVGVNNETAPTLAKDPRIRPRRFKAGLFQDRSDVFAEKIEAALKLPGDDVICDDPRGAIVAMGQKPGRPSAESARPHGEPEAIPSLERLLNTLADHCDWNQPSDSEDAAKRIIARAIAADQLRDAGVKTPEVFAALTERARHRSLHKRWEYHGLDGANALRTLIELHAPDALIIARETIWSKDPALEAVRDPRFKNPLSWTDWRIKQVVFPAIAKWKDDVNAAKLCRDYLALSDADAREIGIELFEPAAKALLEITHDEAAAVELMKHRRQEVRGRAILVCLSHADQPWALSALRQSAPHALAYIVDR
jgi:hypothetical protein